MATKNSSRLLIALLAALIALLVTACNSSDSTTSSTTPPPPSKKATQYMVVEMGTLGGPNTFINCCGAMPRILNDQGTVVGASETSQPNPNADAFNGVCDWADPLINPAVVWFEGIPINLGALPGGYNSFATSVTDDSSIAAGTSETGDTDPLLGTPQCHPVIWDHGSITDLGTFGGYQGIASHVNSTGQVVGMATNTVPDSFGGLSVSNNMVMLLPAGTQQRAFLWSGGVLQDLGTLGGPDAAAGFINDNGDVAGVSYTDSTVNDTTGIPTQHPFLWRNGVMTDLGSFGGSLGRTNGLNQNGQVIGNMTLPGDEANHPFLWSNGVLTDLGTLGGPQGTARAINETGEVVGNADLPTTEHHATLWKDGRIIDLGILPGQTCSTAFSINSHEQVVGDTAVCGGAEGPPFISESGQPMVDLTTLLLPGSNLTLVDAASINERGEILCQAFDPDGNLHTCMLVPVGSN